MRDLPTRSSLLLRLKSILEQKSVSYGLRGTLYRSTSWGTGKIKVDREGELDLENLPDFGREIPEPEPADLDGEG